MARLPHVQLQVIPFGSGAHAAMGRSFVILSFADNAAPDVVYLEDLTSALYLEDAAEVDRYTTSFDHLRAAALPFTDSAALITETLNVAARAAATGAHDAAARLAKLAATARSARENARALREWNANIAQTLAQTQDTLAGTLDRLAKRSPEDKLLQAKSAAARRRAVRQRQRAADIRRGGRF
jgi:hypothetical protein